MWVSDLESLTKRRLHQRSERKKLRHVLLLVCLVIRKDWMKRTEQTRLYTHRPSRLRQSISDNERHIKGKQEFNQSNGRKACESKAESRMRTHHQMSRQSTSNSLNFHFLLSQSHQHPSPCSFSSYFSLPHDCPSHLLLKQIYQYKHCIWRKSERKAEKRWEKRMPWPIKEHA